MSEAQSSKSDVKETYDFIVVGSGAAGLAAAVTASHKGLKTLVLEKESVIGGTSAWSGGWLWIPLNPLARRAGIEEDIAAPLQYLASLFGKPVDDPRIHRFLKTGPEMVSFFEENTALKFFDGNKMPDFHEIEGHAVGGRSVSAAPYDARDLGEWAYKMRLPLNVISLYGMGIAGGQDIKHFFNACRSIPSALYASKRVLKHIRDLLFHRRGMQLVNGNALVARLLRSALDNKVSINTDAKVLSLLKEEGRVIGVEAIIDGKRCKLLSNNGVVLSTGGFPHDEARREQLFGSRFGKQHYSAAPKSNTGDGLRIAEAVGVKVVDNLSNPGAWSPVSLVPQANNEFAHFPHLVERAKPGIIAVLPNGKRFVNEAESYHDFMKQLFAATPEGQEPFCWLICDHKAQRRWGLGWSRPFPFPIAPYLSNGYLKKGTTLQELAKACDLPAAALTETLTQFNAYADQGADPEFKRGESPYNRVQGDPDHKPNSSLASLRKAPFYAVKIVAGSLGTFSGIPTDEFARALNSQGEIISGLYAVGNDMSSIFEGHYPSGGITLGPGMTFGYIAANKAAEHS